MDATVRGSSPEKRRSSNDIQGAVAPTRAARGLPTQAIILALVAVLVIPGIVFAGFLLNRYAESERARYELEGLDVARAAAAVLDRHLQGLQTTLQTLSLSAFLQSGDMEGFYDQAARVKSFTGVNVGLRTLDGQQIINTRQPWGTALPATPFAGDDEAIATGRPVVTDVFSGVVTNRPTVAIIQYVSINGGTKYLLHISTGTNHFYDVLKDVVPPRWLIGVGDSTGTYVTRSENHNEFTGKPGVPAFLALATGREGTFVGEGAFGDKVLVGYARSAIGNWLVAANIKQSIIEESLNNGLYWLSAFGALVLFVASLVALWLWQFIARPLKALVVVGRELGDMHGPLPVKTQLREFAEVRDALTAAARQINSHQAELEAKVAARTRELAEANFELTAQMKAREQAEAELRQIHKMEAIGQLAGGIAHDFNNMLAVIMSSLDLVQKRLARGEAGATRFIDTAMEGANRAAALTNRLLAFSRQQPLVPEVIDANRLVSGMSELLQRTLGGEVKIEMVLGAGLWKTNADGSQLENAILNLCVNGRDAMPAGGRLTIETTNAYLDDDYCVTHDGVTAGQYLLVAVTDTGMGMPDEVIARAFDPFFTTKRTGLGTGLGLSQVYGFVKQSKGHIKIYSETGHGTTIKIYLPRHYGDESAQMPLRETHPLEGGSPNEVILVVEDEDRLRVLTVETLTELGYSVLEAGHAKVALELIDGHPEISLLFTDIVMPDVNGRQLADEAMKRRPGLRVLYTTGFTRNAVIHNGILDTGINFLAKPFTMKDLAAKVRQVLSAEA